jgi:hypothetical protein
VSFMSQLQMNLLLRKLLMFVLSSCPCSKHTTDISNQSSFRSTDYV